MVTIVQTRSAEFSRYRSGLAELLLDAVQHGASVGFVTPLQHREVNEWLASLQPSLDAGQRIVWFAEQDGRICGSVQLDLCQKPNGVNRAEVQKLLVHSSHRRQGIASALMHAVETHAAKLERGLLYLDTEASSPAEHFYRNLGYIHIGGLPEYACGPDGMWRSNAIYYKTLFLRSTQT